MIDEIVVSTQRSTAALPQEEQKRDLQVCGTRRVIPHFRQLYWTYPQPVRQRSILHTFQTTAQRRSVIFFAQKINQALRHRNIWRMEKDPPMLSIKSA